MYRKHRGKRASFIAFIVFAAMINLAPRYPEGGCGSPSRRLTYDSAEGRKSFGLGRDRTMHFQDLNAPLRGMRWAGDNHSRLVLFGKDPSVDPYPPHAPLSPADGPQELKNFTTAVEFAWPKLENGEEHHIEQLANLKSLFPGGVPAFRSVDIGYCSIPMPWIVDDPAKSPAAWPKAARLMGDTFDEGRKGFAQVLAERLDENVTSGTGVRWHNGVRVNVHTITRAPERKQQFWYRTGDDIADYASGADEFCVQADYLFDYFATLLGAIPISTDCEEIASIRFCGRFDAGPTGALQFMASEVAAEMTGTEGTGTCKAVAREIRASLRAELRDPLTGIEAGLNSALSETSTLGVTRVEHMPSRLEIITAESADNGESSPGRLILEALGLCRDRANSIQEHTDPMILSMTDGVEIIR